MNLVVYNEKIRKKNGDLQPIRYEDATYRYEGSDLVIAYHGLRGQKLVMKIPRANVAQILEEP